MGIINKSPDLKDPSKPTKTGPYLMGIINKFPDLRNPHLMGINKFPHLKEQWDATSAAYDEGLKPWKRTSNGVSPENARPMVYTQLHTTILAGTRCLQGTMSAEYNVCRVRCLQPAVSAETDVCSGL